MNTKILATVLLFTLLLLNMVTLGSAQLRTNDSLTNVQKLDRAISAYACGKMDTSIQALEEIVSDTSETGVTLRNALWYLGVCHSAKGNRESARWSVSRMVQLYPKFAPDPDIFPPQSLELYYEIKREIHGNLLIEQPDPGVQTMAIADFMNRSIIPERDTYAPLEKGFADFMIYSLSDTAALQVVERDRFQWVLSEHSVNDSSEMEKAVRAGKLLGVHAVLLGSFMVLNNDDLILLTRLVKVETGEILFSERHEGEFDDFIRIVDELGEKIALEINIRQVYQPQASVPNTLEAMLAYSRGKSYMDQEMYIEAFDMFELSLKHDPTYLKAEEQQGRIEPDVLYAMTKADLTGK